MTRAPSAAHSRATARPIPRPAPVTATTLPSRKPAISDGTLAISDGSLASGLVTLTGEAAEVAARVSNWGRWGGDDEIGTLNLITAEAVRRGASAVVDGRTFSLAIPFSAEGPQLGFIPGRVNPERKMI